MGNTTSTQNLVYNSVNMSLTQSYVNKNVISASVDNTNTQELELSFGYNEGCSVDTSQTIKATTTIVSQITTTANVNFASSLADNISNTAKQNAEMTNGMLAATGGNSTNTVNSLTNLVSSIVKQTLTNTNIIETANKSYNKQSGKVYMAFCKNAPIKMSQDITSTVISTNLLNSVTTALMDNSVISGIVNDVDQKAKQHNQGFNDVLDSLFNGIRNAFTGPAAMCYIAGLILCCVCCVALLYFMLSPAGQQATVTASNAGANYASRLSK